jgi:hypothetical protein
MARFERMLEIADKTTIIDVGGTPYNWRFIKSRPELLIVNTAVAWDPEEQAANIRSETGDGCCLRQADKEYDVAFSNAVIEHLGTYDRQRQFAQEVRRVGQKIWVQTPARCFLVETHFLTVAVQWLPRSIQRKTLRWLSLKGLFSRPRPSQRDIENMVDEIRLLTRSEMTHLFPGCQIITERLVFWPKSYIAVRS